MKKILVGATLAALAAPAAWSQQTYGDVARVVSATPITERVSEPRRDCRTEPVTVYEERRTVRPAEESPGIGPGTVLGAVVGGESTIHGAPVTREVERCNTVSEVRDRVVGFDVRYEYNGREFRARMPYDPGPQMAVNVEVRPPVDAMPDSGPRIPRYRGTS